MRLFLIMAGLIGLAACSGTRTLAPLEAGATPEFDPATQGIIAGSSMFSGYYQGELKNIPGGINLREGFRCSSYTLMYRGVSAAAKDEVGDLSAIPPTKLLSQKTSAPYDYDVDQGHGTVHATIVPAGDYEVWYAGYYCNDRAYYLHDFRIPFEVLPGQVHYAGEVQFLHKFGQSFLNTPTFDGALFRIEDQRSRDLPLLYAKYPFLETYPVVNLDIDWTRIYGLPPDD